MANTQHGDCGDPDQEPVVATAVGFLEVLTPQPGPPRPDPPSQQRRQGPPADSSSASSSDEAKSDEQEDPSVKTQELSMPVDPENQNYTASDPVDNVAGTAKKKARRWIIIAVLGILGVVAVVAVVAGVAQGRSPDSTTTDAPRTPTDHIITTVTEETARPTNAPIREVPSSTLPPRPLTKLETLLATRQFSCGVMDLPGQSQVSSDGQRVGFSIDLVSSWYCKPKEKTSI